LSAARGGGAALEDPGPAVSAEPAPPAEPEPPAEAEPSASPSVDPSPDKAVSPSSAPKVHPAVVASAVRVNGSDVDSSYQPTDAELEGTAMITMAAGDEAGMLALALMQSLRDVGTRSPRLVVMLMQGGQGSPSCKANTPGKCGASDSPGDIVSQEVVDALHRLGVETPVLPALPASEHTKKIAGGLQAGWGMAFNKLRVFGMTEHRRVLWMDADTLVLRNVDHLLAQPEFTAAFTNDCNNNNAAYKISGGMWVLDPSKERMDTITEVVRTGQLGEGQEWRLGDMEIVLYLFSQFTRASREDGFWPSSYDTRQGRTPGVELYDKRFAPRGEQGSRPAGPLPAKFAEARAAGLPVWHPLDVRYGHLAQECAYLKDRELGLPRDSAAELGLVAADAGRPWGAGADDLAAAGLPVEVGRAAGGQAWSPVVTHSGYSEGGISLHYSCMQPPLRKPSAFASEQELVDVLRRVEAPCVRRNVMLWYSKYLRAMGGKRFFDGKESPPADSKIAVM